MKAFFKWLKSKTHTEFITLFCLFHGCLWVDCSYVLAWCGRTEIAEDLSKVAITEIIGVVLIYALKEGVANLSKYNKWPDKPMKETVEKEEERTI